MLGCPPILDVSVLLMYHKNVLSDGSTAYLFPKSTNFRPSHQIHDECQLNDKDLNLTISNPNRTTNLRQAKQSICRLCIHTLRVHTLEPF